MDQPTDNIITVSVSHLISHRWLDFEAALHSTAAWTQVFWASKWDMLPNIWTVIIIIIIFLCKRGTLGKATVIKEETYWLIRLWEFILRVFFQALNCIKCIYVGESGTIISFCLITCWHYSRVRTIKAVKWGLKHGCTTCSWSKCVK